MQILIGAITGILLALLAGASLFGLAGFALFGALAGFLGALRIGAVETFYWIMLLVLVILLGLMWTGIAIPTFVVMLPVIMMICRLTALWGTALASKFQS